jgi:hypothetical protein
MVTQSESAFPRTENVALDDLDEATSNISTSQSLRIHKPSYIISSRGKKSFYEAIENQRRKGLRQRDAIAQKGALRQDCTQNSMLQVDPLDIERKIAILSSSNIPEASPIHSLQSLETGWDGYWAKPLSQEVLFRANQLWRQIKRIAVNQSDLPTVQPAANGSVAFTWSHEYPEKELEIWLYDQPDYYAEWMLSVEDEDEENAAQSQTELLKVIKRYQEL